MANRTKAVVFDVGRVIIQWDLKFLFAKLIDDPEELNWFCSNVVTEQWHFQHDAGRSLSDMVSERKSEFPEYAHLIDAYATRFLETCSRPIIGTCTLIEQLASNNIPLFAITNFGAEFWDQFRRVMNVLDYFSDIVVSGKEKLVKPNPLIFDLAAKRFGYPPSAMLFIDDNSDNIEVASQLGWQTHHFLSPEVLQVDLLEKGLI